MYVSMYVYIVVQGSTNPRITQFEARLPDFPRGATKTSLDMLHFCW